MELLEQQTKAINKLHRLKVGALFMEPGTGKTRTAYELIKSVKSDFIIWLTPFQTKENLIDEINLIGGFNNIIVTGIETLSSSDREYLKLLNLVSSNKCFLIIDESIKVKNMTAIRTKRILELSKYCEYKLILNGTPITRNILDIWSQIQILSPKILNMDFREYKNTFCEWVQVKTKVNGFTKTKDYISKFHNVDYLYSLIDNYIFECDLDIDVEKNYIDKYYNISEDEKIEYSCLKEKYLNREALLKMNNNIFLEMTMKMQHSYCIAEDKFNKLKEILKYSDIKKTLCFVKFIKSKQEVKHRFPNLEVLTFGKHALGLNLQSYNTVIWFDKTFDYGQLIQSQFRTYRIGQKDNCYYYRLTGNVGLEKIIEENIQKKQSLLNYFKMAGIEFLNKEL